jgi:hypothetical protein
MDMTTSAPISACIATVEVFPDEDDNILLPDATALTACPSTSKANVDAVLHMSRKGMVKGMEITGKAKSTLPCEPCLVGKQACTEISKSTETCSDEVLGCIHSDICGKLPTRSREGFEYFITWIDDKSHKVSVTGL